MTDDILKKLQAVVEKHGIPRNMSDRMKKLGEEHGELVAALLDRCDIAIFLATRFESLTNNTDGMQEILAEAADMIIVLMDIIIMLGGDPRSVVSRKLDEVLSRPKGYK